MTPPSTLARLLDGLPATIPHIVEMARQLERQGRADQARDLLEQALRRGWDGRLQFALATLAMAVRDHGRALELLGPLLDPRAPDLNVVVMMCECVIETGDFALGAQYVTYARDLGCAPPRVQNLEALLQQRVRERNGQHQRRDLVLDARLAPTTPELTNLPLSDTSHTSNLIAANDPTDFITFDVNQLAHQQQTTALEEIPTHINALSVDAQPTLSAKAPVELFDSFEEPDHDDPTFDSSRFDPLAPHPLPQHTSPTTPIAPPSRFAFDEDEPTRDERLTTSDDFTMPDIAGVLDPMDLEQTSHAALKPHSSASSFSQNEELYMPMRDESESPSMIRSAYFGSSHDLMGLAGDSLEHQQPSYFNEEYPQQHERFQADPAPSFGARPAPSPAAPTPPQYAAPTFPAAPPQQPHLAPSLHTLAPPRPAAPPSPASWPQEMPAAPMPSLELDLAPISSAHDTPYQPSPRQAIHPATPPHAAPVTAPRGRRVLRLVAIGAVLLLVLAAGVFLFTDHMHASTLRAHAEDAARESARGTYLGELQAQEHLLAGIAQEHPLGPWANTLSHNASAVLPVLSAPTTQAQLLALLASSSARIELFYEAPGTRHAADRIAEAERRLGANDPQLTLATLQSELLTDPHAAFTLARQAQATLPSSFELSYTFALANLLQGHTSMGEEMLRTLQNTPSRSALERRLLIGIEDPYHPGDAAAHLDTLREDAPDAALELHILRADLRTIDLAELERSSAALTEAMKADGQRWHPCFEARVHHAQARIALAKRDLPATLATLKTALERCPQHPQHHAALITHLMHTGELIQARARLDTWRAIHPRAHFEPVGARLGAMSGDTALLKEMTASPEAAQKAHPGVMILAGEQARREQDFTRARALFEQSLALDAQRGIPSAHKHLLDIETDPAAAQSAMDAIAEAIEAAPQELDLQLLGARARMLLAAQESDAKKRDELLARAQRRLTTAIAMSPYEDQARFLLCALHTRAGRLDAAREACQSAHELNPRSMSGALIEAELARASGHPEEAIALYTQLELPSPAPPLPLVESWLRAEIEQGELDAAQARLDALTARAPDLPLIALLRGRMALEQGDAKTAISHLTQASTARPHQVEAQIWLARAQIAAGERDIAEKPLKDALSHPTQGGYAWLALGELRRRQGRFKDAEENFQQAEEELERLHAPARYRVHAAIERALTWRERYDWRHARVARHLEAARALAGDHVYPELQLQLARREMGQRRPDRAAAQRELARAIVRLPNDCETLKMLSKLDVTRVDTIDIAAQLEAQCAAP